MLTIFILVAGDQYGNYLIQWILVNASPHQREAVATHIRFVELPFFQATVTDYYYLFFLIGSIWYRYVDPNSGLALRCSAPTQAM